MASTGRVLVVDDEPVVCAGISRVLQRHGYEVETALGARPALDRLREGRVDVMLVDIMMPTMNGLDLLRQLRERGSEARIIVITGLGAARNAIEAFRLGAFDFVTKPFTSDELLAATMRAASPEAAMCATLRPPEHPGFYRLGTHSWVRRDEGGTAVAGIQECFQRTAGRLVSVDLPNEGDELTQGELCARIRAEGGAVYTVWSPLTGRVVEVNLALLQQPALANTDPYGQGWFFRMFPASFAEESGALQPPPA
jgi:CheY-like chemotaxis protein/glycine cleavage system H lipoate-binding protein